MTNKKELNKEELNKVSGGLSYDKIDRYFELKKIYNNKIDDDAIVNYINQDLLFKHESRCWILGTLLNYCEESAFCGKKCKGTIKVIESDDFTSGETTDIYFATWTVLSK